MQFSFYFCKTCICLKILENIQISVSMIDRLDFTDEYSVKCEFILKTVIFIDAALNISLRKFWKCNIFLFSYLAEGFRMRPKVWSTLTVIKITKLFAVIMARKTSADTVELRLGGPPLSMHHTFVVYAKCVRFVCLRSQIKWLAIRIILCFAQLLYIYIQYDCMLRQPPCNYEWDISVRDMNAYKENITR